MATTSVTIRMDENLKKQAETLFDEMGMNMTTAINIFAKAVVRQGKIPFEIAVDPFFTETNMKALRQTVKEADEGKLTAHDLIQD